MEPTELQREEKYYTYKGVYIKLIMQPDRHPTYVDREKLGHFYLHLNKGNTTLLDDTPLDEVRRLVPCEHIRREVSHYSDEPKWDWEKPLVHYLCGCDFQHSWHYYDPTWEGMLLDAVGMIDSLQERGVLTFTEAKATS